MGALCAYVSMLLSGEPNRTAHVDLYAVPEPAADAEVPQAFDTQDAVETALLVTRSDGTLAQIAQAAGLGYSAETVAEVMDVEALDGAPVLRVSVTMFSDADALALANAAAQVVPARCREVLPNTTLQAIDQAQMLNEGAGVRPGNRAASGAVAGAVVAALAVAVSVALDGRVRDADLLVDRYGHPNLAVVPKLHQHEGCVTLRPQASESYKLLRANVMHRLPEQGIGRVIGITSAVHEEGKTTTAVNLAYALAELGMRTLLVDADMRTPGVSGMLRIARAPGLSNVLTGRVAPPYVVQQTRLMARFLAVSAGDLPANPTELIGSTRMPRVLDVYADHFDYIVVDLPPAMLASDALVLAPVLDGVLVVARRGFTKRRELDEALKRLSFAGANVLGFVTTRARVNHGCYESAS